MLFFLLCGSLLHICKSIVGGSLRFKIFIAEECFTGTVVHLTKQKLELELHNIIFCKPFKLNVLYMENKMLYNSSPRLNERN